MRLRERSESYSRAQSVLAALLIVTSLSGCAHVDIKRSVAETAAASQTGSTIAAVTHLPQLPTDCTHTERSGVVLADRLDVALVKTDRALERANARTARCSKWYMRIRERTASE